MRFGCGDWHGLFGWSGFGRDELPELGGEEAGEAGVVGDVGESGGGEGGGVVGEAGGAEAGEDAEGEVEAADEARAGRRMGPVGMRKSEMSQRALGGGAG